MAKQNYDFSGWATRFNIRCSDGKTICPKSLKWEGDKIPLVWAHNHNDVNNVLGHAYLEERPEGVYAYCSFNNTQQGQNAKEMVEHGDICSLSIFANKIKTEKNGNVTHGMIRELSLVLAPANPGAHIDYVVAHEDGEDESACIYHNAEGLDTTSGEIDVVPPSDETETVEHTENEQTKTDAKSDDETFAEIYNTLNDKQKALLYVLLADASNKPNKSEDKEMKQNAFENNEHKAAENEEQTLSHDEFLAIVKDAKTNYGSLKESFIAHGITNVEALFPEAHNVTPTPKVVDIEHNWVSVVMNGVKHSPFSRIKSTYATLTADEARAKGYVKGKQKVEEIIAAAKRTTTPQTVYKLQKMDRDDVIDITDFDVIAFLKKEMRTKLDEELARAILVGDGRNALSDDKISEDHIRSIANDNAVYTVTRKVGAATATVAEIAAELVDDAVLAGEDYKGAGNPVLFCRRDVVTRMLLIKDKNQRRIYKDVNELATAMMVNKIVTVPSTIMGDHYAIMVDLSDYVVGADKGGNVTMFDDFDLNYNKQEYLIETRCSGANCTPYSAVLFTKGDAASE